MKRFYKLSSCRAVAGGWQIELDGKPVRTPAGHSLIAPAQALAQDIVAEWGAQEKEINAESMPLTQILTTALDRVALQRQDMEALVLKYLDTDLLCYRAVLPAALAQKQAALWNPWLSWFFAQCGATLSTTTDLAALRQPQAAHGWVKAKVSAMDDTHFSAFQLATGICGSLVLALALYEKAATAQDVFTAMNAEEDYKAEIYNEDVHGAAPHAEKQRAAAFRDLTAAQRFLEALR